MPGIICVRQRSKRSAQKPEVQRASPGASGVTLAKGRGPAPRAAQQRKVMKTESRKPKAERKPKIESRKSTGRGLFRFSGFGFLSDFGFRISAFIRLSPFDLHFTSASRFLNSTD